MTCEVVLTKKGSPVTMVVFTTHTAPRRAKDGRLALACRVGPVDHPPEPALARPPGLAAAAPADRHALRPGAADRGQLAARRRTRGGLPSLLLLPGQPRTQCRL